MSEKTLTEISSKLDKLIKLEAITFLKGVESEQEKIKILDSLGFKPLEIASMLDKTPQNIYVVLSQLRKKQNPAASVAPQPSAESTDKTQLEMNDRK